MKKNSAFLMILLTVTLGIVTACGNTSEESTVKPDDSSKQTQNESDPNASKEEDEPETKPSTEKADENNSLLTKEQYLVKLNEMEEEDRNGEVGTTTVELENQETERFEKWNNELNHIYGLLQEPLSSKQMEQLQKEQREWIQQRDEKAKKASLAYQGGSMEALEYVATQASLTKERCYELVAKYMK